MTRQEQEAEQTAWMNKTLKAIQYKKWFGTVTLKIEEGIVKRAIHELSEVPPGASSGINGR